jgi:hypothetical protein
MFHLHLIGFNKTFLFSFSELKSPMSLTVPGFPTANERSRPEAAQSFCQKRFLKVFTVA